ncbi:DUF3987 domain-containing protein [Cronobacter turicensis]
MSTDTVIMSTDANISNVLIKLKAKSNRTEPNTWLRRTVRMLERTGYCAVPCLSNGATAPYGDTQTYPREDTIWQSSNVKIDRVAFRLDDVILLDYDGNKAPAGEIISVSKLADLLGLSGLMQYCTQTNDEGNSLHFLFRWPEGYDRSQFKAANNGKWLPHIDVKTGNQLCYLKQGKQIIEGVLPFIEDLPEAPVALVEALRKELKASPSKTTPEGHDNETDIEWFNRTSPDWESLFFEYGFEKHGDKWLHPGSTTGNPGISINRDNRYVSSHGCDPLSDGHSHDKFDFVAQNHWEGDKSQLLKDIRQKRLEEDLQDEPDGLEWLPPKELKSELVPVQQFDARLLPEAVRDYVKDYAARMDNAAPDYAAISVMIAAGAVIGGTAQIQPKRKDTGWRLIPNLWGSAIGYPSAMKTPSLKCGLDLLAHSQKVLDRDFMQRQSKYEAESAINNARRAEIEQGLEEATKAALYAQSVKDAGPEEKQAYEDALARLVYIKESLKDEPKEPKPRELMVNDSTVEALAIMASNNPQGIMVFRDELSGWLASLDSPQRPNDRAFYLEGFSCGSYKQSRVSRAPLKIDKLIVSLLGGIQPGKLAPILAARAAGGGDDGLLERIIQMSVFPDLTGEYRDAAPDIEAERRAKAVFETLADAGYGDAKPAIYTFSEDAQKMWDEWATEHKKREQTANADWQGILGKYPALCAKIALVYHLLDEADGVNYESDSFSPSLKVTPKSLRCALHWMEYLESHATRITSYFRAEKAMTPAITLRDRLPQLSPSFTRNSLGQKDWRHLTTKEDRESAIEQLIKTGHIREVTTPPKNGTGRPSVSFLVNPHI